MPDHLGHEFDGDECRLCACLRGSAVAAYACEGSAAEPGSLPEEWEVYEGVS